MVQDDTVVFSPSEGTWLVSGKVTGNSIEASRTGRSFDGKTFATALKAILTETHIQGTYATPSCTYEVALDRF